MKIQLSKTTDRLISCFLLTYILNCLDLIFTYTYLKTGLFYEANPIMNLLLNHSGLSIIFKLLLPALLIIYLFHELKDAAPVYIKVYYLISLLLLLLYVLLDAMHLYYFFQLVCASS